MHKLKTITYIGRIEAGRLRAPRDRIDRDMAQVFDEPAKIKRQ